MAMIGGTGYRSTTMVLGGSMGLLGISSFYSWLILTRKYKEVKKL